MKPYLDTGDVQLYHGDMRHVLTDLTITADCIVTDPPYGETSLGWDRWPTGWPDTVQRSSRSMWCFGSMRMFLERRSDFAAWKLSQDCVWEKQNGSGFTTDRFRRVHEHALHFYQGSWSDLRHEVPRIRTDGPDKSIRRAATPQEHYGDRGATTYADDGTRLMRSVIPARNMHRKSLHPTEKPEAILRPLIEYACPPGGLILDPFAGSGSTATTARLTGRRTVLIEADEQYCEAIATRLSQNVLPLTW